MKQDLDASGVAKNSISSSTINANAQIAKFASRNYLITNSNCTSHSKYIQRQLT